MGVGHLIAVCTIIQFDGLVNIPEILPGSILFGSCFCTIVKVF